MAMEAVEAVAVVAVVLEEGVMDTIFQANQYSALGSIRSLFSVVTKNPLVTMVIVLHSV